MTNEAKLADHLRTTGSRYNARIKASVRALAKDVRDIPTEHRAAFCAAVMVRGLMRTHWWLRMAVWLGCKVHRNDPFDRWVMLMRRLPSEADNFVDQVAQWAEGGKDAYDPRSMGGFCQDEVDVLDGLLAIVLCPSPMNPGPSL